jgi:hypothetical protein
MQFFINIAFLVTVGIVVLGVYYTGGVVLNE